MERTAYALVKEKHCPGHFEPRIQSIEEHRVEQGVASYDEKARAWLQPVVKPKSAGPTLGQPSPISNQVFFMASYDVDRFRAFVMSPNFNETYTLPPGSDGTVSADDEALLDFGLIFSNMYYLAISLLKNIPTHSANV